MYIDERSLRHYFEQKTWDLARQYAQKKTRLHSLRVEHDRIHHQFVVEATVNPTHFHTQLTLEEFSGELLHFHCDCPFCGENRKACVHVGMVLILLQRMTFSHYPYFYEEETDNYLLQYRRRQKLSLSDQLIETYIRTSPLDDPLQLQADPVSLQAEVDLSQSVLLVSFRIGRKKKYILKNLHEFLQRMENGEVAAYGKQLQFLHVEESLDPFSVQIFRFLRRHWPYQSSASARALQLSGSCLDDFYHLFLSCPPLSAQGQPLVMIEADPPLTLRIEPERNDTRLSVSPAEYRYIRGNETDYVVLSGTLIRLKRRFRILCGPLLRAMQGGEALLISAEQLRNFYYNVLQPVSEQMVVQGIEELNVRMDPLISRIYIDEPVRRQIMITVRFCYGRNEYDGFDGEMQWDHRNQRQEQRILTLIRQYATRVDLQQHAAWIEQDELKTFSFLSEGVKKLMEVAEVFVCDSLKNFRLRPKASFHVGVRLSSGLLEMTVDNPQLSAQEIAEIFRGWQQKKKYVRLKDNEIFALNQDQDEAVMAMLQSLQVDPQQLQQGKVVLNPYRSLTLNDKLMEIPQLKVERDPQFRTMIRDFKNIREARFEVPPSLKPVLRDYQKEGFRWLKTLAHYGFGGILADDMGIGKTVQMIAVLEEARLRKEAGCSLIVTPASLILNWQAEIHRFAPQLRCQCIHGSLAERKKSLEQANQYDVLITSYDYLKRDEALYVPMKLNYLVLDEAQAIKNQRTRNAQSVKRLSAAHRFALTGTPIENSLAELWSLFDFLMPGYLNSYRQFREEYELPVVRQKDQQKLALLKRQVSPFMLRRKKSDVLKELPEKTETVLTLEFSETEKKLYQATLAQVQAQLKQVMDQPEGWQRSRIMVLAMLTRLRQICCDPGLVFDRYDQEKSKLSACMELLESAVQAGKKVLLFSQFTTVLDQLQQQCSQRGWETYLLTGSTTKQQRFEMMERFNRDATPVFLISLKAGGTGLNLTGAEIVVHYDPWWNLSAEHQATDRAYRMGQQRNVQVYKLIVAGTVEEKIHQLQLDKQTLSQSVIEGSDGSITAMSREEIMALFAL